MRAPPLNPASLDLRRPPAAARAGRRSRSAAGLRGSALYAQGSGAINYWYLYISWLFFLVQMICLRSLTRVERVGKDSWT